MDPVVHFELPCADRERISRFYAQAFGWTVQMLGPEMGHYVVVTTADADGPMGHRGAINGGFYTPPPGMPAMAPGIVIAGQLPSVMNWRRASTRQSSSFARIAGSSTSHPA